MWPMQGSPGEGSNSIRGVRNASGRIILLAKLRPKVLRLSLTLRNFFFYEFDLSCLHSGQNREPTTIFFLTFQQFYHLMNVANARKPWGRVQLHHGGQEYIRKGHYFCKIVRGWKIFLVDLTVCKLQTF